MSSDIKSAYAARDRPVSSWPLAAAIILTVLATLLAWVGLQNAVVTSVVGLIVGSLLTVRYGPSWSRVIAYGLTVGLTTAAVLAGWILTNAVLAGASSVTPLALLTPAWPSLVAIPIGVPLLSSGVYWWLRRGGQRRRQLLEPLPLRAVLGLALVVLVCGAAIVGFVVLGSFNESSPSSSPSSGGTGGEPFALVSVTESVSSSGTYEVEVYAYRVENADTMTVSVIGSDQSVTVDAGRTTTLTGLEAGDELRITVSREDTTKEVRTVTVGE